MKRTLTLLAVIAGFLNICVAQTTKSPSLGLTINGISFLASKEAIIKKFGKPVKQFEPHYKCGFLSDQEQSMSFYSLQYPGIIWTGNQKEGYLADHLLILPGSKNIIQYKGKRLSAETTLSELSELIGAQDASMSKGDQNSKDLIKLFGSKNLVIVQISLQHDTDDKYIFSFHKNKLCKIEYWSPC